MKNLTDLIKTVSAELREPDIQITTDELATTLQVLSKLGKSQQLRPYRSLIADVVDKVIAPAAKVAREPTKSEIVKQIAQEQGIPVINLSVLDDNIPAQALAPVPAWTPKEAVISEAPATTVIESDEHPDVPHIRIEEQEPSAPAASTTVVDEGPSAPASTTVVEESDSQAPATVTEEPAQQAAEEPETAAQPDVTVTVPAMTATDDTVETPKTGKAAWTNGNGHKKEKQRDLSNPERDTMRAEFIKLNGQLADNDKECTRMNTEFNARTPVKLSVWQVTGFISLLHYYVAKGEMNVPNLISYLDWMKNKYPKMWARYHSGKFQALREKAQKLLVKSTPTDQLPTVMDQIVSPDTKQELEQRLKTGAAPTMNLPKFPSYPKKG